MKRVLGLALALAVGAAHAAAPAKKAPPLVELKKDFNAGEFERVIRRAETALKAGAEPADVAQLQLWRGKALLALGREDDARQAFTSAVEAWPDVELDAQRASPTAVRVFEQARQAVPGTLSIAVTGGDATVRVDDKDLGPSPLVTQLPPGKHVVEARGAGELAARADVEVKPGKKLELPLELKLPEPKPVEPKPEPLVEHPAPPPPPPPEVIVKKDEPPPPPPEGPSRAGLVPLIGGVALGAVGGVLLWQAQVQYDLLYKDTSPVLTPDESQKALSNGPVLQGAGWAAVGVGAAGIAVGVLMLVMAPSSPVQPSVIVTPGGAGVSVSAALP